MGEEQIGLPVEYPQVPMAEDGQPQVEVGVALPLPAEPVHPAAPVVINSKEESEPLLG